MFGGQGRAENRVGGSPDGQKEFLEMLESDIPKGPQERNRRKPPIANEFALGYTYQDVLDADQEGIFRLKGQKVHSTRTHRAQIFLHDYPYIFSPNPHQLLRRCLGRNSLPGRSQIL